MNKKGMALVAAGALVVALAIPTAAFAAGPCFGFASNAAACQGGQIGTIVQGMHHRFDNQCAQFADEDNDGVCDNYGTHRNSGGAYGYGSNTACPGFVDADNNGECDSHPDGVCDGTGPGSGQGLGGGQGLGNNQDSNSGQQPDNSRGNGNNAGRGGGHRGGNGAGCWR